jgi:hypothetical protein
VCPGVLWTLPLGARQVPFRQEKNVICKQLQDQTSENGLPSKETWHGFRGKVRQTRLPRLINLFMMWKKQTGNYHMNIKSIQVITQLLISVSQKWRERILGQGVDLQEDSRRLYNDPSSCLVWFALF